MVHGQLHSLSVAHQEDAGVAHVGGAQLGGAPLFEERAHHGGGPALGASHATLAERGQETGRGLDELVAESFAIIVVVVIPFYSFIFHWLSRIFAVESHDE